jgi:hypothetical protein
MGKNRTLYVAYGSNLNIGQMAQRCPTAKVLGAGTIRGRRLLFRGGHESAVATVEPHRGGSVPVLVWAITPADEAALDRYEGFPFLYRKETIKVWLGSEPVNAMVYIMNTEGRNGGYRPLNQPGAYYYTTILDGYKEAGFNTDILRKATENSVEAENVPFTEVIRNQIMMIRASGETNMFDTRTVHKIALRESFEELAGWLPNHKTEYSNFIITGNKK